MRKEFKIQLEEAESLAEIFEVVKAVILKGAGKSRGGLMLGMADLGNHPQGLLGGFFTVGSNVIVVNKIPLQRIRETRPELYRPYAFSVLLHEYIHSLGYLDESVLRSKVLDMTRASLGDDHPATKSSKFGAMGKPSLHFTRLIFLDLQSWHASTTRWP